jgi:hypothetical protein
METPDGVTGPVNLGHPVHADHRGLYWVQLIVHGDAGQAGLKNFVDLDVQRKTDVVAHQLEQ